MFVYDTINTLLAIIFLFNVALLLPLLRNIKNNVQTLVYVINIVTILLWIVTMMGYRSQGLYFETWLRLLYVAAIFIGVTYMQFTFFYPIKLKHAKFYIYSINILAFITAYIVTLTDKIITYGVTSSIGEPKIIFGSWYLLYVFIIIVPFTTGFLRHLYVIIKHKSKVSYLLIGYLISANVAFVTNLMLPWFGVFIVNWVGQFFTVIMVSFTTYSILRFNVMNIKFFAIHVGVILLLIVTFSQILFADSPRNFIVSSLVFIISLVTGYFLVALSRNERKTLEHTVLLNKKIKKINSELEDANEKLQSLDKLKSEFVSLASHQLRSPLTVIKGYAAMLVDDDLKENQAEMARHIYTSAQGMANVVEDFLNVTKIEQGGMKYIFAETDVKAIVNDLVSDMRISAEAKHLTFSSEVDPEGKYSMNVDGTKLKQVFLNLIDNSIKYTKEGFVKVGLRRENDSMVFFVSDSGVGVSEESRQKLFQKFNRGSGEGAAINTGGSGLGLYLAQEIVKAHKGEITIESEGTGKGSTFSVILPLL